MIPDLPLGLAVVSAIAIIATFGSLTFIGYKVVDLISNWKRKDNPKEFAEVKKENQVLKDRVANLEELVCRLDQEINRQFEKSLWWSNRALGTGNSQQMTAMINISSALENRFQILQ